MGWVYGFGIPIAYVILGFLISRATYRSRHKRGLTNYADIDDTVFLSVIMAIIWPFLAPIYFPIVWWGVSISDAVERFYKHNLPETRDEKERRLEREAREAKNRVDQLERELGIGPYQKDL